MMNAHFKPLPILTSDAEAEDFVETAELSEYDLSGFTPMSLDIEPKEPGAVEQSGPSTPLTQP